MEQLKRDKPFMILDASILKWIAIVTMLIDHIAASYLMALFMTRKFEGDFYYQLYRYMRLIGRIAFPIFVFMLVEGFYHTRSRGKYLLRLGIFALISEIPFDMAFSYQVFDPSSQNVGVSLFLAFLMMMAIDAARRKIGEEKLSKKLLTFALSLPMLLLFCALAIVTHCDYVWGGILLTYFFYWLYKRPLLSPILGGVAFMLFEPSGIFGALLMLLYNGKKGKQPKYFFYLFYPLHLLMLGILSMLIYTQ